MQWEEIEEIEQIKLKVKGLEYLIIDEDMEYVRLLEEEEEEFYKYWMDVADPRGTYLETLAMFKFEQASGSGEWDY